MSLKKLSLNRESLLALTHEDQDQVQGGLLRTAFCSVYACDTNQVGCRPSAMTAKYPYQCC